MVKTYPPNDYVLIEDIQLVNENSKVRCVGMTFETRPDYCKKDHINRMLNFGVTRVELGVQTLSDELYTKVKRGHTIADVIESNQLLRDSAINTIYHFSEKGGDPFLLCISDLCGNKNDIKKYRQIRISEDVLAVVKKFMF